MDPATFNPKIFFGATDVDEVMQELITLFERKLFPTGAPERPTVSVRGDGGGHSATSSGQPLVANSFSVPPLHIPNAGDGANARHSYKSELVLVRDPKVGTKKILWWHGDDPRETPHNHPWNFRSGIISGGYTEERFWLSNGVVKKERRIYTAGMVNEVPADVYHNVLGVLPGTVTFLDCGEARDGNEWGYLNKDSGEYTTWKGMTPANFLETFQALNPHTVKKAA